MEKNNLSKKEISDIVNNILEKNNIGENEKDGSIKYIYATVIATDLTKKLISEIISENEFLKSLIEKLEISQENSILILKEIKEKILPFTEKINTNNAEVNLSISQKKDNLNTQKQGKKINKVTEGFDKYREEI